MLVLVSGCLLGTQSITLVPRWRRHPRLPRATMEVSQSWQRLLESVLCHQSVDKIKARGNCDAEKSEKFNIICLKKSEKSEHFYVTHEHLLKKISIILALFWQKTSTSFSI